MMIRMQSHQKKTLFYILLIVFNCIVIFSLWGSDNTFCHGEIKTIITKPTDISVVAPNFNPNVLAHKNEDEQEESNSDLHEPLNIDTRCRYNSAVIISSMRQSQRELNKIWQNFTHSPDERWETMMETFESFGRAYRLILKPFSYHSDDEVKYFVEFANPKAQCNAITIGVGNTWRGEIALRQKYPQCNLVGIDPSENNRKFVESIPRSKFHRAALHQKKIKFNAYVLNAAHKTVKEQVVHEAFYDILVHFGNGNVFDFMTIDAEGAEFSLLNTLHTQRHMFAKVCQFNMELHYAEKHYDVTLEEFDKLLNEFLDEAHFVLLSVTKYLGVRRLWFLNVGDQACIQKFLC